MPTLIKAADESLSFKFQDSCKSSINYRTLSIGLVLVLCLSAATYIVLALNCPKFNRAEVFFAECAREMLRASNLVTPLYHSQPFFDKPVLVYWLIIGAFKTFGTSHFVARIPSIISALALIAVSGATAGALAGLEGGLLAAMALGSSFMFMSFAALCMSDMPLVLFDTITLGLLYLGTVLEHKRNLLWWLASASMGLAFLTKGPVGIVLPTISFLLYMSLSRQLAMIKLRHLGTGLLTATVLAAPWFIAAFKANGTGAMYWFFVRENLQRFAGSTYDTHRPIWFMVTSLMGGFLPWSVFLPFILASSIRQWRVGTKSAALRLELFLWLWIAVVTGFFSISRGKIDYYCLPAYPACAILVGLHLSAWLKNNGLPAVLTGWALALSMVLSGGASCIFLSQIFDSQPPSQWLLVPASLIAASILAVFSLSRKRYFQAYALSFVGISLAAIGFGLQVLPLLSSMQPPIDYATVIRQGPLNSTVGIYKTLDNWIDEVTFQTGREPVKIETVEQLAKFLQSPQPVYAMVPQDSFDQLPTNVLSQVRVISCRPFLAHSLNPGYVIQNRGHLNDGQPLLLVTQRQ